MIFAAGLAIGAALTEAAPGGGNLWLGFALALAAWLSLPAVFGAVALVQVLCGKAREIRRRRAGQ